jgi:hypothetical protein
VWTAQNTQTLNRVVRRTRLREGKFNIATVPPALTCAEGSRWLSVDVLTMELPLVSRTFRNEPLARIEKRGSDPIHSEKARAIALLGRRASRGRMNSVIENGRRV